MEMLDPNDIDPSLFPLFVFSDDVRGFLGWAIKSHTKGSYNHVMMMTKPRKFLTQGFTYKQVSTSEYMKSGIRLKFWQYTKMTPDIKKRIYYGIECDLKLPWWRKGYDFLGIVGQAINIKWINNPWRYYCSERVARCVNILPGIKVHPKSSPSDINKAFIESEDMKIVGYWWED